MKRLLRAESLGNEVPIQTRELTFIDDRSATSQPFIKRGLNQCLVVDIGEHVVHRVLCNTLADPGAFDFLTDTQATAALYTGLRSGNGFGEPRVVQRVFAFQPNNRFLDFVRFIATAEEACSKLRRRQLSTREEAQGGWVAATRRRRGTGTGFPTIGEASSTGFALHACFSHVSH